MAARVLWVYTLRQEAEVEALLAILRRENQPPDDVMALALSPVSGTSILVRLLREGRYAEATATTPAERRLGDAHNPSSPSSVLSATDQSRLLALQMLPSALHAARGGGYTHVAHLLCGGEGFHDSALHSFSADVALLFPEASDGPVGFRSDVLVSAVETLTDMLHYDALQDRLEALAAVSTAVRFPRPNRRRRTSSLLPPGTRRKMVEGVF